jgi:hypothetical protein
LNFGLKQLREAKDSIDGREEVVGRGIHKNLSELFPRLRFLQLRVLGHLSKQHETLLREGFLLNGDLEDSLALAKLDIELDH